MHKDDIIADVRAQSEKYAAKFGYDIAAITADLEKQAAEKGYKTISLPPKKIKKQRRENLRKHPSAQTHK
jgi:hypothetical protein